jgi:hypothetical protein
MMKKFLISFLLLTANLLYSQTLEVTGDTVVYGLINDWGIDNYLTVKNIGTDTSLVVCAKNFISGNDTTASNDFCWGGTCYLSSTIVSLKVDTLAPGEESQPGAAGFKGSFHPGIPGPATPSVAVIEYCFYPQSNTLDQTCVTITYHADSTISDIQEVVNSEEIGSFYPNPTDEYTNLFYNVEGMSVLQITDILGNTVKNIEMEGSGEKTIYVGDLHKGIYFGNLVKNGEIIKIKKLIINK